jgi:hypothetical protein
MSEAALEGALRDLGAHLAWPPEADVAPAVRSRLENVVPARPRRARRVALLAAAALLVLGGLLAASPGLRAAFFRLIGIEGAVVEVHETLAPPRGEPFAGQALLGEVVSVEEAEDELGFGLATIRGLGRGEGPFLLRTSVTPIASVAYRDGAVVFSQFAGRLEEEVLRKAAAVGAARRVSVDGAPGLWVEGPHAVFVEVPGGVTETTPFLSGNALLWTVEGVTFRLEGAVELEDALRLARSVAL